MAIFEGVKVTEASIQRIRLTHTNDFFGVGYNGENVIVIMTPWIEEGELKGAALGGSVVDGNDSLSAFGSSVEGGNYQQAYDDMITEIANRGLTYP